MRLFIDKVKKLHQPKFNIIDFIKGKNRKEQFVKKKES